ncbi:hypothetical protein P4E94_10355 [Pontiellaceae bacterium B12219]|nr:hypothetical protein [Pontiellaceae bacterium B12219]
MQIVINILFWLGIVALIDGSLGLIFEEKWQKMTSKWNVRKVALVEVSVAWCMLAVHFALRRWGGV